MSIAIHSSLTLAHHRLPDLLSQSDPLPVLPEMELKLTVAQIFAWVMAIDL